jgi:hypothetical protein
MRTGVTCVIVIAVLAIGAERGSIEQTSQGHRPPATLVASFDGLGAGFSGPHGSATPRNPSDNSLAVGPNHIVQTVNTRMAVFTKKGRVFDETGRALYGPVPTNNVFRGFGGACEARNNGDAVVRYDQLCPQRAAARSTRSVESRIARLPQSSGPARSTGRRGAVVPAAAGHACAAANGGAIDASHRGAILDVLRDQRDR